MKTLIVYNTNTGNTKSYADMLSQRLNCEIISLKKVSKVKLDEYDTVVFGGWVRASKIVGLNSFKKHFTPKTQHNLLVYAVGANSPSDKNLNELKSKNILDSEKDCPLFYLQGGFDPDKLSLPLKMMLSGVAKSLKKKEMKDPASLSQEDKEFLDFFQSKHNHVDGKNLDLIIDYIERI